MSTSTLAATADELVPDDARPRQDALFTLLGLALIAALLPVHRVWLVSIVLAALVLTVPGVLMLRALRIPAEAVNRFPIFVPAAAVLVITLSGLLADLVGPHLGIARPLSGDTTALTTIGVCIVLWLVGLPAQDAARLPWVESLTSPRLIAPVALPLLAAAGAMLLTNGRGATVASVAAVAIPVALLGCLLLAPRMTRGQVAMVLFACALAAEWAFSLRSQEIVGFDISTEVGIAERVHAAGIWHALNPNNAYSAMLSLTVLPSALSSLTGIAPLIAFKVVYPVLTALLPVAVFLLCERLIPRAFAAGAAAVLLVQSYFFEQLPEIARQEIGLLFFAALVAAILEDRMSRRIRSGLVVTMGVGLVVSHYSSTYMAVILFATALVIDLFVSNKRVLAGNAPLVLLALVVVAGGAAIWYGAVTDSASNLTSFTHTLEEDGLKLFPTSPGNVVKSYLNENVGSTVTARSYQQLAVLSYRGRAAYIHPLGAASQRRYQLQTAAVPVRPVRLRSVSNALGTFDAGFDELLLAFAGIGTILALFSVRRGIQAVGVLSAGMIGVLAAFRFSATLAASYNLTRALLQALILLAMPAALLVHRLASRIGVAVPLVLAVVLSLIFAYEDGATWLIVHGGPPLNLAQSGEDFERFYETPAELASASWVTSESGGKLLYTDRYGSLRVAASTGVVPLSQLTPKTLDRTAWVYGSRTNTVLGRARGEVGSDFAVYRWPSSFLDTYFDTVFNDGDSKIYHR